MGPIEIAFGVFFITVTVAAIKWSIDYWRDETGES